LTRIVEVNIHRWGLEKANWYVEAILSEDGKVRKERNSILRVGEKKIYYRPINELVPIMHA
jgi:hypothetical protein